MKNRKKHFQTSRTKGKVTLNILNGHIEDDGGIGGKCICVQLIAIQKNDQTAKPLHYAEVPL